MDSNDGTNSSITVIDALMGEGKTTYIFNLMNHNPNNRYIYIGMNLEESNRATRECPDLSLKNPVQHHGRKYWDLVRLVQDGENISSTHQLFKDMRVPLYQLFRGKEYTLIIDEALDVVSQYEISPSDLTMLLNNRMAYVDDRKLLRWNHYEFPNYAKEKGGRFRDLVPLCDNGSLVMTRDGILIWQFPAEFLQAFKKVYVLTYMFEGQVMANYLQANKVDYELATLRDGQLVPFNEGETLRRKVLLSQYIHVDDDEHRNSIGRKDGKSSPLTEYWYRKRVMKNAPEAERKELKQVKTNTAAFFKECGTGALLNMYTTFDKYKSWVKGPRYNRYNTCFVSMNMKATDAWKHKTALAYLVDRRMSPIVAGYFEDMNIPIREDLFSLTELIQWIWRSGIRKHPPEAIQLYLPSERMRTILTNWILYPDADIVAGQRLDAVTEEAMAA